MNDSTEKKYFDLYVSGIGYLNRAREVQVQRGEPFLAVDISALHGSADNVEYTRFDCRVSGKEAKRLIQRFMPDVKAERKVLAAFKLGDLYPEIFTYENGDKAGQTGVSLKARLLRIAWVKVDGKTVYTAPDSDQESAVSATPADQGQAA